MTKIDGSGPIIDENQHNLANNRQNSGQVDKICKNWLKIDWKMTKIDKSRSIIDENKQR